MLAFLIYFNDLDFVNSIENNLFFLDDLAVITLTESFVDLGHQNILPICLPEDDYDYTDYATQYTIIGMSVKTDLTDSCGSNVIELLKI